MRAPKILRLLVPLLLLASAACASGRQRGPAPLEDRTTVRVENRKFLDVNVYVLSGSQRVRLGTVSGLSTRVLRIPDSLVFGIATLRFQADPIGSGQTPISTEITVQEGDQVVLTIPG